MLETGQHLHVLLVEDCAGDVGLVRQVLREERVPVELSVAADGDAALRMLSAGEIPRPDLIVLDLNLPRRSGMDVLAEVKSDLRFRTIPVSVLTSSTAESDIRTAYELGANCYIIKPLGFDDFRTAISETIHFWHHTAKRVPRSGIARSQVFV